MITFGVCPRCGLKLGRKGGWCPKCAAYTTATADATGCGKPSRAASGARGFYIPILFAAAAALILIIFIHAERMGIAPW